MITTMRLKMKSLLWLVLALMSGSGNATSIDALVMKALVDRIIVYDDHIKEALALQEEDQPPLVGMAHCNDAEVDGLLDISDILIEQLEGTEPFWAITQERLIALGNRIINLCDLLLEEGINGTQL